MSIIEEIIKVHKYFVDDKSMKIIDIQEYPLTQDKLGNWTVDHWRVQYTIEDSKTSLPSGMYYNQYTKKEIDELMNDIRKNKLERICQ